MQIAHRRRRTLAFAILLSAVVWSAPASAQGNPERTPSWNDAVGSWFGRAVPVPGGTICPPGAPGCPVPTEIVMVLTINKDGTFVATETNMAGGANHSTGHGAWERTDSRSINGAYTLLQNSPSGALIGGFKNLFHATAVSADELQGGLNAFLYAYAGPGGAVITDSDGFPTPSPLAPSSECATTPGCTHLGEFTFVVRRIATK
ncbi:MAG TPA: hypothetical protein VF491_13925 [Vicinamibacterales bacterium]